MGGFSIWHWLVVAIYVVGIVWPLALVFRRTGMSAWWAALGFLSIIGWCAALWILALRTWPIEGGGRERVFD